MAASGIAHKLRRLLPSSSYRRADHLLASVLGAPDWSLFTVFSSKINQTLWIDGLTRLYLVREKFGTLSLEQQNLGPAVIASVQRERSLQMPSCSICFDDSLMALAFRILVSLKLRTFYLAFKMMSLCGCLFILFTVTKRLSYQRSLSLQKFLINAMITIYRSTCNLSDQYLALRSSSFIWRARQRLFTRRWLRYHQLARIVSQSCKRTTDSELMEFAIHSFQPSLVKYYVTFHAVRREIERWK